MGVQLHLELQRRPSSRPARLPTLVQHPPRSRHHWSPTAQPRLTGSSVLQLVVYRRRHIRSRSQATSRGPSAGLGQARTNRTIRVEATRRAARRSARHFLSARSGCLPSHPAIRRSCCSARGSSRPRCCSRCVTSITSTGPFSPSTGSGSSMRHGSISGAPFGRRSQSRRVSPASRPEPIPRGVRHSDRSPCRRPARHPGGGEASAACRSRGRRPERPRRVHPGVHERCGGGKIKVGAIAVLASLAMTTAFHAGYRDLRSGKIASPLAGDVI